MVPPDNTFSKNEFLTKKEKVTALDHKINELMQKLVDKNREITAYDHKINELVQKLMDMGEIDYITNIYILLPTSLTLHTLNTLHYHRWGYHPRI